MPRLSSKTSYSFCILEERLALNFFTDCKTLSDVISKRTRTPEKRLLLIAGERGGFCNKKINDTGPFRSEQNLADSLTKKLSQSKLQAILSSGKLDVEVEQ